MMKRGTCAGIPPLGSNASRRRARQHCLRQLNRISDAIIKIPSPVPGVYDEAYARWRGHDREHDGSAAISPTPSINSSAVYNSKVSSEDDTPAASHTVAAQVGAAAAGPEKGSGEEGANQNHLRRTSQSSSIGDGCHQNVKCARYLEDEIPSAQGQSEEAYTRSDTEETMFTRKSADGGTSHLDRKKRRYTTLGSAAEMHHPRHGGECSGTQAAGNLAQRYQVTTRGRSKKRGVSVGAVAAVRFSFTGRPSATTGNVAGSDENSRKTTRRFSFQVPVTKSDPSGSLKSIEGSDGHSTRSGPFGGHRFTTVSSSGVAGEASDSAVTTPLPLPPSKQVENRSSARGFASQSVSELACVEEAPMCSGTAECAVVTASEPIAGRKDELLPPLKSPQTVRTLNKVSAASPAASLTLAASPSPCAAPTSALRGPGTTRGEKGTQEECQSSREPMTGIHLPGTKKSECQVQAVSAEPQEMGSDTRSCSHREDYREDVGHPSHGAAVVATAESRDGKPLPCTRSAGVLSQSLINGEVIDHPEVVPPRAGIQQVTPRSVRRPSVHLIGKNSAGAIQGASSKTSRGLSADKGHPAAAASTVAESIAVAPMGKARTSDENSDGPSDSKHQNSDAPAVLQPQSVGDGHAGMCHDDEPERPPSQSSADTAAAGECPKQTLSQRALKGESDLSLLGGEHGVAGRESGPTRKAKDRFYPRKGRRRSMRLGGKAVPATLTASNSVPGAISTALPVSAPVASHMVSSTVDSAVEFNHEAAADASTVLVTMPSTQRWVSITNPDAVVVEVSDCSGRGTACSGGGARKCYSNDSDGVTVEPSCVGPTLPSLDGVLVGGADLNVVCPRPEMGELSTSHDLNRSILVIGEASLPRVASQAEPTIMSPPSAACAPEAFAVACSGKDEREKGLVTVENVRASEHSLVKTAAVASENAGKADVSSGGGEEDFRVEYARADGAVRPCHKAASIGSIGPGAMEGISLDATIGVDKSSARTTRRRQSMRMVRKAAPTVAPTSRQALAPTERRSASFSVKSSPPPLLAQPSGPLSGLSVANDCGNDEIVPVEATATVALLLEQGGTAVNTLDHSMGQENAVSHSRRRFGDDRDGKSAVRDRPALRRSARRRSICAVGAGLSISAGPLLTDASSEPQETRAILAGSPDMRGQTQRKSGETDAAGAVDRGDHENGDAMGEMSKHIKRRRMTRHEPSAISSSALRSRGEDVLPEASRRGPLEQLSINSVAQSNGCDVACSSKRMSMEEENLGAENHRKRRSKRRASMSASDKPKGSGTATSTSTTVPTIELPGRRVASASKSTLALGGAWKLDAPDQSLDASRRKHGVEGPWTEVMSAVMKKCLEKAERMGIFSQMENTELLELLRCLLTTLRDAELCAIEHQVSDQGSTAGSAERRESTTAASEGVRFCIFNFSTIDMPRDTTDGSDQPAVEVLRSLQHVVDAQSSLREFLQQDARRRQIGGDSHVVDAWNAFRKELQAFTLAEPARGAFSRRREQITAPEDVAVSKGCEKKEGDCVQAFAPSRSREMCDAALFLLRELEPLAEKPEVPIRSALRDRLASILSSLVRFNLRKLLNPPPEQLSVPNSAKSAGFPLSTHFSKVHEVVEIALEAPKRPTSKLYPYDETRDAPPNAAFTRAIRRLYGYASTRGPEIIAEAEAFSSSHHGGLLHGEAVEGARRHLAATSVVVEAARARRFLRSLLELKEVEEAIAESGGWDKVEEFASALKRLNIPAGVDASLTLLSDVEALKAWVKAESMWPSKGRPEETLGKLLVLLEPLAGGRRSRILSREMHQLLRADVAEAERMFIFPVVRNDAMKQADLISIAVKQVIPPEKIRRAPTPKKISIKRPCDLEKKSCPGSPWHDARMGGTSSAAEVSGSRKLSKQKRRASIL